MHSFPDCCLPRSGPPVSTASLPQSGSAVSSPDRNSFLLSGHVPTPAHPRQAGRQRPGWDLAAPPPRSPEDVKLCTPLPHPGSRLRTEPLCPSPPTKTKRTHLPPPPSHQSAMHCAHTESQAHAHAHSLVVHTPHLPRLTLGLPPFTTGPGRSHLKPVLMGLDSQKVPESNLI